MSSVHGFLSHYNAVGGSFRELLCHQCFYWLWFLKSLHVENYYGTQIITSFTRSVITKSVSAGIIIVVGIRLQ